jgi:ribosome-associated protein
MAQELARDIAGYAGDKKAIDVVVLQMGDAVSYTDFFVIATGATTRQTRAIADGILENLRRRRRPARVEGAREAEWILLDFIDVVVHVFTPAARDFYRLEALWGDIPRLAMDWQA